MKYPSKTDLIATILAASRDGATIEQLMAATYLPYGEIREDIILLMKAEVLAYDAGSQEYKVGTKGKEFLEAYHKIVALIRPVDNP